MDNWQKTTVGALCVRVCSGGTPKSSNPEFYALSGIPWLNTKEIDFNRVHSTEKHITEAGFNASAAKWVDVNSVIVAMYGATAGKCCINKIPLTTNQACCNLTVNPELCDYRFLYFYLCDKYRELALLANGGAQQNLNAQIIKNFEIDLPPLETQRKIAAILSALDDKIELNRRINANLEQQAAAIFKSKFCDFDDNAGQMPSKWNVATFGEIAEVVSGKRPPMKQPEFSEDVNVPLVGASTIMGYTNNILYNEPILVIGRVGTHGVVQRFQTPCWPSDNTLVIKSEYYEYAFHFLKNVDYVNMNRGSTQPLITQTDLKNLLIVLPEKRVLKEFEKLTGTLMARWETNRAENEQLAALRDALLPRLMSGEIDVSDFKF